MWIVCCFDFSPFLLQKENQNIDDAFFYLANEWHKMYSNGVNSTLNAAWAPIRKGKVLEGRTGFGYRPSDMPASRLEQWGERTVWLHTGVSFEYSYKQLRDSLVFNRKWTLIDWLTGMCMGLVTFIMCLPSGNVRIRSLRFWLDNGWRFRPLFLSISMQNSHLIVSKAPNSIFASEDNFMKAFLVLVKLAIKNLNFSEP